MLLTLQGRLAFADIWTARPPQDGKGDPKFGAVLIIDPKSKTRHDPDLKQSKYINDAIKKVAKEKWKDKAEGILRVLNGDAQKWCYFEEDKLNQEGDVVDGFEGMFWLKANSPIQPTIIDRDRTELARKDGRPYPGCYVIMKVDIWPQDNVHGKGMRAQLQGLQFLKDGDAFGGGTRSKVDDFEDLSDLGDDDDAPARRSRAQEDEDEPAPRRKPPARRQVEEDEDEIA